MAEIADALSKGGWGVATLALVALAYVWKWANTKVDAANAELKALNARAWAVVDRAQAAKQNGGSP